MPQPAVTPVPQTSSFRAGVQAISPPWLAGTNGYKFTYSAIGIIFDTLAEYLRLGVLQRFPQVCQPEALQYIGADRKILRGFRESDDAYAARLRTAFRTWRYAGNAPTLLTELAAYFSPTPPAIRYVVNGTDPEGYVFTDWWTIQDGQLGYYRYQDTTAIPSAAGNWNWDGDFTQRRFWIIVYRNEGFTPWFWGDGHYWGGGQSWGYEENFTDNFAADARNLIRQWKAAGTHCQQLGGIIVTGNTSYFDPTTNGADHPHGTWSTYANRVGIPTTFYLDGV